MVVSGAIPPAMIFTGPDGSGRCDSARAFAYALSCEKRTGCGSCSACRANDFGEGYRVIDIAAIFDDEAEKNKTTALRRILATHSRTHQLRHCIVVIRNADRMNDQMQASVLKTIEEPAPRVSYIFIVPSRRTLAATIRSRSVLLTFAPREIPLDKSLEAFLLSPPPKNKKRAEILDELRRAIPAAAARHPHWKKALLALDESVTANAHLQLAFSVFRSSIRE